jgi:hypothetical protein
MTSAAWAARGVAGCMRAGALATTSGHTADHRHLRTLTGASVARDHPGDSGARTVTWGCRPEEHRRGDERDSTMKGASVMREQRHVARRLVGVLAAAILWAGVGSGLLTSTAAAGGVDGAGVFAAAFYNATPYTWTLVKVKNPRRDAPPPLNNPVDSGLNPCNDTGTCWGLQPPAATLAPGSAMAYRLAPFFTHPSGFEGNSEWGYDGWFTYRVDEPGAAPVYVSLSVTNFADSGGFGNSDPVQLLFFTTQPPPDNWDPGPTGTPQPPAVPALPGLAIAPYPPGGGMTWQLHVPQKFDLTFAAIGNFTIDASTDQGKPFVDLLNSLCPDDAALAGGTCSFTATTPVTYGPGALGSRQAAQNCIVGPSPPAGELPPNVDPNYKVIEQKVTQSASLSVGGGLTVSAEFSLFGSISSEASVSVEAEHEWEEVQSFSRDTKVYVPSNSWGFAWWAPTVGRVTGTLVAKIGSATFTANNFTEVRSGVTGATDPLRQPSPAFNVVTNTRPMTAAELAKFCGVGSSARSLLVRRQMQKGRPPARLVVGGSVAGVALGETQEAVVARLGWPAEQRFALNPCKGMPGCTAVQGLGGTWNYKKRRLSVVFGPDRRVVALVHSGNRRTKDGVGRDSTLAHLRGRYPGISCAKAANRVDCTVKRVSGQQTIRTVFRLADRLPGSGTRWKTSKVLIYVDGHGRANS